MGSSSSSFRCPGLSNSAVTPAAITCDVVIGSRLFMSPTTVKTHLKHIFTKVGINSRARLGAEAVRRGLA